MPTTSYSNAQKSLFGYTESPYMVIPTPARAWACPPPPSLLVLYQHFHARKLREMPHFPPFLFSFCDILARFSQIFATSQPPRNALRARHLIRAISPFFSCSVFSLAFFNVGTRHCSLIDDCPIKRLPYGQPNDGMCDYGWRKVV